MIIQNHTFIYMLEILLLLGKTKNNNNETFMTYSTRLKWINQIIEAKNIYNLRIKSRYDS